MADISILSRLVDGVQRNVDVSQNSLVVGSLKVGTSSPAELTKTILNNLINLQNGSDFANGTNAHTHDGRYFTETELQSTADGASGASKIGIDVTPAFTNFTPSANTVQGALEGIDSALASAGNEKSDSVFRIVDNGDATKKIAFEASAIATATTRTITMPNANVNLADVNQAVLQDGSRAMLANLSLGGFKITNLLAGTNPLDAVNKAQLDAALAGLDFQPDVDAYVADASSTSPGLGLPAAASGQRYILASNTGSLQANWGAIAGVGDGDIVQYNGSAWVVAYDVSVQGEGALVWNRDQNYFMRWDGSSWAEFGGLAGVTAGAGLLKSGNVLSIELDTNSGLEFDVPGDSGKLRVAPDNSTLERSASGLRVKASGITANELATDSVTNSKIQNAAVDANKLATNSVSTAKIQNAAVDKDKLNSNVADQSTITGGAGSALAVQNAPAVKAFSEVAGEAFAATTLFAVRYGQNAETAGRMYKADNDATSVDNFYAMGLMLTAGALSAADPMPAITKAGLITVTSHGFTIGKPVYLGASGAITSTAPSAANSAVVRLGVVKDANTIDVQIQIMGVN